MRLCGFCSHVGVDVSTCISQSPLPCSLWARIHDSTSPVSPGESLFQRDGIQGGVEYGRISIAVASDGQTTHSYDPTYLQVHDFCVCGRVCLHNDVSFCTRACMHAHTQPHLGHGPRSGHQSKAWCQCHNDDVRALHHLPAVYFCNNLNIYAVHRTKIESHETEFTTTLVPMQPSGQRKNPYFPQTSAPLPHKPLDFTCTELDLSQSTGTSTHPHPAPPRNLLSLAYTCHTHAHVTIVHRLQGCTVRSLHWRN